MYKKIFSILFATSLAFSLFSTSCTNRDKNLGTKKNPVIVGFMPSATEEVMKANADVIVKRLAKESGLEIKADVSKDYLSMIDKLGSKKMDIAFINSLGYLLARDWSGAQAIMQLKGVDGKMDYRSAIIAHTDSGINSVKDLNGKNFVYTSPYSMAGYLMPLYVFTENKVKPSSTAFVSNYTSVISGVYNKKAAGGAIYYHKPDRYGRIRDARENFIEKHNDLLENVKIIDLSGPIPNSPIVFRKALPEDVKSTLTNAITRLGNDQATLAALGKMYDATGFGPADDASFKKIQAILKKLNKKVEEIVPGAVTFYKKHIWEIVPEY
jgi:phosphonate transport system substrate-binding protein